MPSVPDTKALEEWFGASGGYLHNDVRMSYDEALGVHYRAVAPIGHGTTFASAPHSLALSYLNALVDDAFPVFKQQKHLFKVEAIGFFYLMAQYVNAEKSFWKPYIDTLPTPEDDFSQPLFFEDPADIAWLEGTDVWHTVTARKQVYERYYQDGITVLRRAGIDVEPYTWNLFKWATTIYTSRSFTSLSLRPEESRYWTTYKQGKSGRQTVLLDMSRSPAEDLDFPVLFPGLDAANHWHEAKVDWSFNPGRFSIGTSDGIEAGCEVFNNYGPKANDELLIGYGFCIPNNPYDTVAMTLKAPPEELQKQLRIIQPGYFTAEEHWNSEKATFRLRQPTQHLDSSIQIFRELPEPLLELLVYILRHERGLDFSFIPKPLEYLTASRSAGEKYLPHVARMIVQSLGPKLATFGSATLSDEPKNKKQAQAAVYRASQLSILESLISALRTYTRSLIWTPPVTETKLPTGPSLVRLEVLLRVLVSSSRLDHEFLKGIEASANTQDVVQLRLAGWEEDIWVLLLCYVLLKPDTQSDFMLPEYLDGLHTDNVADSIPVNREEIEQGVSLMDIVHAAALACPNSLWQDERWSPHCVVGVGGNIIQHESFTVMCPLPDGGEEARLCVLLHSSSGL